MNIYEFNNTVLLEDKLSDLAEIFGDRLMAAAQNDHSIPPNVRMEEMNSLIIAQELAKADPTGNKKKGLLFLIRSYSLGQFLMEDLERVRNDLATFFKYLPRIENKNLESYRSLEELYAVIEPFQQQNVPVSKRQEKMDVKKDEAVKLIDTPNLKVVVPKTYEASCMYGAGTKWCTTSLDTKQHFDNYTSKGPLYYITANLGGTPRKFAVHYETNTFMNEKDVPVEQDDIEKLSQIPDYKKFVEYLINKHYTKYFNNESV